MPCKNTDEPVRGHLLRVNPFIWWGFSFLIILLLSIWIPDPPTHTDKTCFVLLFFGSDEMVKYPHHCIYPHSQECGDNSIPTDLINLWTLYWKNISFPAFPVTHRCQIHYCSLGLSPAIDVVNLHILSFCFVVTFSLTSYCALSRRCAFLITVTVWLSPTVPCGCADLQCRVVSLWLFITLTSDTHLKVCLWLQRVHSACAAQNQWAALYAD